MTVLELIKILNKVENKNILITSKTCGDGFIALDHVSIEKKPFGYCLVLSDYRIKGNKEIKDGL